MRPGRELLGMNPLTVTTHTSTNAVHLRIVGEIDMATAEQVTNAVRDAITAGAHDLRLDLAEVTFCDSSGIRALLFAQRDAAAQGVIVRVDAVHQRVVRVLELTGVVELLRDGPTPPPSADA